MAGLGCTLLGPIYFVFMHLVLHGPKWLAGDHWGLLHSGAAGQRAGKLD